MLHTRKGEGEGEDSFTAAARADFTPHLPPALRYGAAGSPLLILKGRGEQISEHEKESGSA